MKPLILEVFPSSMEDVRHYVYPQQVYIVDDEQITAHDIAVGRCYQKHLTDAELAAEYHQQAAYAEYWMGRTTATHTATNQDRAETLRRFACTPSYDESE